MWVNYCYDFVTNRMMIKAYLPTTSNIGYSQDPLGELHEDDSRDTEVWLDADIEPSISIE